MDSRQILFFAVGIALCLFGWLFYLAGVRIVAVILGGFFGIVAAVFISFIFAFNRIGLLFIICVPLGMVFFFYLSQKLHKILFFIAGASIGSLLAYILRDRALLQGFIPPNDRVALFGFHLIFVLAGGILAVVFSGYLLCIVTSLMGIFFISLSFEFPGLHPLMLLAWLCATIFQIATLKMIRGQDKD